MLPCQKVITPVWDVGCTVPIGDQLPLRTVTSAGGQGVSFFMKYYFQSGGSQPRITQPAGPPGAFRWNSERLKPTSAISRESSEPQSLEQTLQMVPVVGRQRLKRRPDEVNTTSTNWPPSPRHRGAAATPLFNEKSSVTSAFEIPSDRSPLLKCEGLRAGIRWICQRPPS